MSFRADMGGNSVRLSVGGDPGSLQQPSHP